MTPSKKSKRSRWEWSAWVFGVRRGLPCFFRVSLDGKGTEQIMMMAEVEVKFNDLLDKPRPRYRRVGTVETIRDGSPEGISPGVVLYAQLTPKRISKKGTGK